MIYISYILYNIPHYIHNTVIMSYKLISSELYIKVYKPIIGYTVKLIPHYLNSWEVLFLEFSSILKYFPRIASKL